MQITKINNKNNLLYTNVNKCNLLIINILILF